MVAPAAIEFAERLAGVLHPGVYAYRVRGDVGPFALVLRAGSVFTARYALAVLPWESVGSAGALLPTARRLLRRHFRTVPTLVCVGLYLVVVGPRPAWEAATHEVRADHFGLRRVIVQAVHFADPVGGGSVLSQSRWPQPGVAGAFALSAVGFHYDPPETFGLVAPGAVSLSQLVHNEIHRGAVRRA